MNIKPLGPNNVIMRSELQELRKSNDPIGVVLEKAYDAVGDDKTRTVDRVFERALASPEMQALAPADQHLLLALYSASLANLGEGLAKIGDPLGTLSGYVRYAKMDLGKEHHDLHKSMSEANSESEAGRKELSLSGNELRGVEQALAELGGMEALSGLVDKAIATLQKRSTEARAASEGFGVHLRETNPNARDAYRAFANEAMQSESTLAIVTEKATQYIAKHHELRRATTDLARGDRVDELHGIAAALQAMAERALVSS